MTYNPNGQRSNTNMTPGMGQSSGTMEHTTESTPEGFLGKAEHMAHQVKDKAEHMAHQASTAMSNMGEKITDMAGTVREKALTPAVESLSNAGTYLKEHSFHEYVDDVGGIISRHPWPSLLSGLAIGFLLGRSIRR